MPTELLGKPAEELRAFCAGLGDAAYRGAEIYHALYAERRFSFSAMSNLPAALRGRLAHEARITMPRVARRFASSDGSVRYLLELGGETKAASVEAVFMPSENRQTICISTQAGCAGGFHLCLTAQLGLIRKFTAGGMTAEGPL